MVILTKKKQKDIERCRDIIFDYIKKHPIEDAKEMSDAIEALCDMSFTYGIWPRLTDVLR